MKKLLASKLNFFTKAFCLLSILFASIPSTNIVAQGFCQVQLGISNQTVCVGNPVNIFGNLFGGATSASFSGLPSGVSGSAFGPFINISGLPTTPGIYNYTVTPIGDCMIALPASGTITVSADVPLVWSTGSTNQTVCENSPISNIVYTCGGATVTGLPSGVNGNYSGGNFTISGTPTSSGVYNYTVYPSGCSTGSAIGTITVGGATPNETVTSNVVCIGSSTGSMQAAPSGGIPPYTYAWQGGATTSGISGEPAGTYSVTIMDATGCTTTASATIIQPNPLAMASPYIPITLTNSQTSPTSANYQQMITVNSSNYTSYENAGLQNIEFTTGPDGTGTVLKAWIESGNTNTSISTIYWVNLGSNIIPASGTLIIYMNFMSANVMSASGPTGEAPQLSTTYGQYDNGASVFNYYTNFAGTSLPANWSSSNQGLSVNNGLSITNAPQVNVGGYVGYNVSQTLPFINDTYFSSYMTGTGVNGGYGESWWGAGSGGLSNPFSGSSWVTLYLNNGANANGGWTVRDNTTNTYAVSNPPIGIVSEAYTTTSMAMAYNYVNAYTDNYAFTGPFYIGGQRQYNAPSAGNWTMQYTRLRTYPPSGIAPSVAFGSAITEAVISTNAAPCSASTNGSALVNPNGGTAPYTYTWVNSNATVVSTSNATGSTLSAGSYTVTVQDNCGATITASVTITAPSAISPNATVNTNVLCNAGNNGSASSLPSGGTSPYTYTWSDANTTTTATLSNLSAGTYSITVQDANGCSATGTVTITQPSSALSSGATVSSNVSCNGGSNGSAIANPSGGTSPYTYLWSDANTTTTASVSNLTYGSYTVTVNDANNCSATASVTISQPAAFLYISAGSINSVSCNGGSNGTVTVNPVGGSLPYTYTWSNGITTVSTVQSPAGLSAGTYTVTVMDNCGATHTASATIIQPSAMRDSVKTQTNISCGGGNGGCVTLGAKGGTYPYSYSWSNGFTLGSVTGLSAGTYSVLITDNNGCTNTVSGITITQPNPLNASLASVSYPFCNGVNTGAASVNVTGGTTPYTYSWTSAVSTTNSASNISAGTYTVSIKDAHRCTASLVIAITQPQAIRDSVVNGTTVNVVCKNTSTGSATIGAKYGTPPYTYLWGANTYTTATVSGLSAGTYSVIIEDAKGCQSTAASVTITQPANYLHDSVALLQNVGCYGGSGGAVSIGTKGGVAPYTYAWSDSKTTYNITGLSTGTYSVILTDNAGCSNSITGITITQPSAPVSSTISTNCIGNNDGTITASGNGGTPGYTYLWSNGKTTTSITVTNGTYTVKVSDSRGCSYTSSTTLSCTAPEVKEHGDEHEPVECCGDVNTAINLYPNPNSGQFTITGLQQGMTVEMYDYTGRKISSITASDITMQVNIAGQPNGIYLIRILDKSGTLASQKKVVKTN